MSTKNSSSTTVRRGSRVDKAHDEQVARGNELSSFEHHLAASLRIAREHPWIPASLYNALADALNDFLNELLSLMRFYEDERVIALALETYIQQTRERAQTEVGP